MNGYNSSGTLLKKLLYANKTKLLFVNNAKTCLSCMISVVQHISAAFQISSNVNITKFEKHPTFGSCIFAIRICLCLRLWLH